MTTQKILSEAYALIFGIKPSKNGKFYDQKTGNIVIDYALFYDGIDFDYDRDYFIAFPEGGSEGCYMGIYRIRDQYKGATQRDRIGTVKTLDEGRDAWRTMGALAGELSWVAYETGWKLLKEESKNK